MKLNTLIIVILRLLAVSFLVTTASQIVPLIAMLFHHLGDTFIYCLVVISYPVIAILLWIFAPRIATFITRDHPQEINFGTIFLIDGYTIAFMALGVYFFVSELPPLLSSLIILANAHSEQYSVFLPHLITIIFCFLIIVNAHKWAAYLVNFSCKNETKSITTDNDGSLKK